MPCSEPNTYTSCYRNTDILDSAVNLYYAFSVLFINSKAATGEWSSYFFFPRCPGVTSLCYPQEASCGPSGSRQAWLWYLKLLWAGKRTVCWQGVGLRGVWLGGALDWKGPECPKGAQGDILPMGPLFLATPLGLNGWQRDVTVEPLKFMAWPTLLTLINTCYSTKATSEGTPITEKQETELCSNTGVKIKPAVCVHCFRDAWSCHLWAFSHSLKHCVAPPPILHHLFKYHSPRSTKNSFCPLLQQQKEQNNIGILIFSKLNEISK